MNLKSCAEYKEMKIWIPKLCRWCGDRSCKVREYSYDLAKDRERNRRVPVKTEVDKSGQYYWDWFGDKCSVEK